MAFIHKMKIENWYNISSSTLISVFISYVQREEFLLLLPSESMQNDAVMIEEKKKLRQKVEGGRK